MAKPEHEFPTGTDRAAWAQFLIDAGLPPGQVPGFAGKNRAECGEAILAAIQAANEATRQGGGS